MNTEVFGYIAAFCTTISFLPQAIKTIKTKDTKSISLLMYSSFCFGIFMWILYAFYIDNIIMITANIITFMFALIILFYKLKEVISIKK